MKAVWCARKKESQCSVWIGKLNLTKGLGGTVSPWVCSVGNHEAKPFGKLQCLAENCMFVKFDKKNCYGNFATRLGRFTKHWQMLGWHVLCSIYVYLVLL